MYLLTPSTVVAVSDTVNNVLYIKDENLRELMDNELLRITFLSRLKKAEVYVAPISECSVDGLVNRYDKVNSKTRLPMRVILPKMSVGVGL